MSLTDITRCDGFARIKKKRGEMVMNIILLADIHGEIGCIDAIGPDLKKADMVIIAGDIADKGNVESAENVVSLINLYTRNVAAVPGNWDSDAVRSFLEQQGMSVHGRAIEHYGIPVYGAGGAPKAIISSPFVKSEEEIIALMRKAGDAYAGADMKISVTHLPPRDTCDKALLGMRAGSQMLRQLLEEQKPTIHVCGHIHEARGSECLGGTLVVNPGPLGKGFFAKLILDDTTMNLSFMKCTRKGISELEKHEYQIAGGEVRCSDEM